MGEKRIRLFWNFWVFAIRLIDGPFIEEQKDLDLLFAGVKNQRIIDLTSPENAV